MKNWKRKESGSSADVIALHAKAHGDTLISCTELAKLTALSPEEVAEDVKELEEEGTIYTFPMRKDTYVWHADSEREAVEEADGCTGEHTKKSIHTVME